MKTSYSALETFKTCPLKYKYSQIEKRREPKRVESVFGTIVHSSLKYMFERDPLYPTLDEVIDYFTSKWNNATEHIQWRNPARKDGEVKLYYDEGVRILKNFYKKNKPWQFNAVELEGRFSIALVDELTGTEHTLSGIIDRIDKDPESGVYEIIDYKTGKKMPSEEMLKENLQLGVYNMVLRDRWPSRPEGTIVTSLYFLKHNEKVSVTPTKEMLIATREGILSVIRTIEESIGKDDFPATPGPLCNWCGFRSLCPMWSHEYKTDDEKHAPDEAELAEAVREFFAVKEAEAEQKKKLAEAREKIELYMKEKNLARVFGTNGYITRTEQTRSSYDIEQAKLILEKIGRWEDILSPDEKKLVALINGLSKDQQKALLATQKIKSFTVLKHTKAK